MWAGFGGVQHPCMTEPTTTQHTHMSRVPWPPCPSLLQLPAITAVYAGSEQLPAAVEAAVRAQQNNVTSVSLALAAARILEKVGVGLGDVHAMH